MLFRSCWGLGGGGCCTFDWGRVCRDSRSFAISATEFGDGLRELGYDAPPALVEALFDELDDDHSFKIGFHEFKTWLFASEEQFEAQLAD